MPCENCELLTAQAAALLELCDRVMIAEAPEEYLDDLVGMVEGDRIIKARALLDRLATLEDGAMTNQRLVLLENRLQRAEAVVEAAKSLVPHLTNPYGPFTFGVTSLLEALAEWEEGKG